MLRKFRLVISVFVIFEVFLEPYMKRSASLSSMFHFAIWMCEPIDANNVELLLFGFVVLFARK